MNLNVAFRNLTLSQADYLEALGFVVKHLAGDLYQVTFKEAGL